MLVLTFVFVQPAIVAVPVPLGVPSSISGVPPLVVGFPATFPLGPQLMPARAGFRASLTEPGYRVTEPYFGLLNPVPTSVSLVSLCARGGNKEQECAHSCQCGESVEQVALLPTVCGVQGVLLSSS